MPIATGDSGVSRVATLGESGTARGRGEDGHLDARLRVTPCIGRRSDSVMDLDRPLVAGDEGVPKYGRDDVADTLLSSNTERGSVIALADSDVNDDCESVKRLLLACAEDGEVTGLD